MEDRKHMGKQKEGVVIPVAPSMKAFREKGLIIDDGETEYSD